MHEHIGWIDDTGTALLPLFYLLQVQASELTTS